MANANKTSLGAADSTAAAEVPSDATEILIDGTLYDVKGFKHPGGSIIKFLTGGGDATSAYEEFHCRSKKADRYLKALPKRPCPPEILERRKVTKEYEELTKDFKALRDKLKAEGFFEPSLVATAWRVTELVAMHWAGAILLLGGLGHRFALSSLMGSLPYVGELLGAGVANESSLFMRIVATTLGVLVLGMASGRCGWFMHEGGHYSITGKIGLDRMLQAVIYGFGCGMSGRWWRIQHNKHHATPQKMKHDADLDTLPLVSFNARVSNSVRSPILQSWLRMQAVLFIPLSCGLVATGWQTFLHPRHIFRCLQVASSRNEAAVEAVSMLFRYYMFFGVLCTGLQWSSALGIYTAYNAVAAMYIFTNFALSHTHLPTTDADEFVHWVRYASEHTTNLRPGVVCNWWMCWLNFQIEHHLFPSMPQFRHPKTAKHVQALFAKHGLKYDVRPYFSCLGQTLANLHEVGQSAGSTAKPRTAHKKIE